jgi:phosphoribosylanthranilate isomerase
MRVKGERTVAGLELFPNAAYYLLDTYREGIAGGTGETFDWDLAAGAKSFGKPIFLSGGLNPENVSDAVRQVRPFAVDAASGVEASPGIKDHDKIKEFIENVRKADATA